MRQQNKKAGGTPTFKKKKRVLGICSVSSVVFGEAFLFRLSRSNNSAVSAAKTGAVHERMRSERRQGCPPLLTCQAATSAEAMRRAATPLLTPHISRSEAQAL